MVANDELIGNFLSAIADELGSLSDSLEGVAKEIDDIPCETENDRTGEFEENNSEGDRQNYPV